MDIISEKCTKCSHFPLYRDTRRKQFKNVEELADYVENELEEGKEHTANILPPSTSYITDEEDVNDEEIGDKGNVSNVCGDIELELHQEAEHDITLKAKTSTAKNRPRLHWKKVHPERKIVENIAEFNHIHKIREDYQERGPFDWFCAFFDDELIQLIVQQSNLYCGQKNVHNVSFDEDDIKAFIGFLLYTGYVSCPQEEMYWSLDLDCNFPIVRNAMSRQRYRNIKKCIHLADNDQLDLNDKFAKVRPYVKILNKKFQQFGIFKFNLSVDEENIRQRCT